MKFILAFALLSVAIVRAYYDPNYCDPFPKNKVTSQYASCLNVDMGYGSNEQGILINALFLPLDCPNEMVINKTTDWSMGPPKPVISWTFSYSIKWADATSKCVVGPPDIGVDQNGIPNDPLADISAYAVNQWYTRQFTIEAGRTLNFSISCASNSSNTTRPYAIAKDFKWTMGSMEEISYTASPCPRCYGSTVFGAECWPSGVEDSYGRAVRGWVFPTSYIRPKLENVGTLNVSGDVIANEIYVYGSIYASGCFFSYDRETGHSMENKIKVYVVAGQFVRLLMNPSNCAAPEFEFIPLTYHAFPGMPENTTCQNFTYDKSQVSSWQTNYGAYFSVPTTAITCIDVDKQYSYIIVAAVVPTVVFVVAITVGAFFAIKKHKQLKLKNKNAKKIPPTPKNDFLPAPMSVVTPKEEASDAAVHH